MEPNTLISQIFRLNPLQKQALARIKLETLEDLLRYLPSRYDKPGQLRNIAELQKGEDVVISGKVISSGTSKAWKKKIPLGEAIIEDQTGKIKIVWFHQAYLAKKLIPGNFVELRGKVAERSNEKYLTNPEIINISEEEIAIHNLFKDVKAQQFHLVPIYPETRSLSSGWFYYHIQKVLSLGIHEKITDPISEDTLKKYNLPSLKTALVWIHRPRTSKDAEAARKRFAFEEVFFLQLARLIDKRNYQSNPSFNIKASKDEVKEFLSRFPFTPTKAQIRAIDEIISDFGSNKPMTRLLEGDVGSGKTAVAATAAFVAVRANLEVAYMAPTEILAKQHFESFIKYFSHLNIQIGLITGSGCYKFPSKINKDGYTNISRQQLLKWVANGEIPILLGTHTLIQKSVKWKNLALAIIDEQHRFGVMQRSKLIRKQLAVPHLLSMTATPIPRTLALTVYGDLDLTLLDELPAGRKPVTTKIINESQIHLAYQQITSELAKGHQAYIICPRIDEPDPTKLLSLQVKSVKTEAKYLQEKIFPNYQVDVVHSKLKPKDKAKKMADFIAGKINILVSTSVVEVGMDVPNATVILIEGAERFGLAQLHQLRGRVARSSHPAYCFLLTNTSSQQSLQRLQAVVTAKNGFELAEMDLKLRGAGSLTGEQQWGLSDLGMEAIRNLKLVTAARTEAQDLLAFDPNLQQHQAIAERISSYYVGWHGE